MKARVSRRGAILGLVFASQCPIVGASDRSSIIVNLEDKIQFKFCKDDDKDCLKRHTYEYALEVHYKDRMVRFTPTELMDILEGKGL